MPQGAPVFLQMKMKKIPISALAALPFVLLVALYELTPLFELIRNSFFTRAGAPTIEYYVRVFTTPLYQASVANSLKISVISAAAGLLVAFFGARAYYAAGKRFRKAMLMILNMTSNFSGVPLTFAFMILMGNTGVLTLIGKRFQIPILCDLNLYSGNGLLGIYLYFQIPLATLLLLPAFLGLRPEWKEAASLLGAGERRYWTRIGVPNLLPALLGTLNVLFANALAAYATAYSLLLNNYALLALQISSKFKGDVTIDRQMGGALAAVLIMLMLIATFFHNRLTRRFVRDREVI